MIYNKFGGGWTLSSLNGSPFEALATLTFEEPGRITGQAPCNRFGAELPSRYPDFALGPIMATKRACHDLEAEQAFLSTLAEMTRADMSDAVLTLSSETDRQMVFHRSSDDALTP